MKPAPIVRQMAQRHVHYEAAFEDFVRSRGWPYIPVNERKKAIFAGARIKSFDFILYRPERPAWLVDVKGRKFPYEGKHGKRYWENWVTQEDIDGLREWDAVFGDGFEPVFVFAYWLAGVAAKHFAAEAHIFKDRYYAFTWISASEFAEHARMRSPKWQTVAVPGRDFRRLIRPIDAVRSYRAGGVGGAAARSPRVREPGPESPGIETSALRRASRVYNPAHG